MDSDCVSHIQIDVSVCLSNAECIDVLYCKSISRYETGRERLTGKIGLLFFPGGFGAMYTIVRSGQILKQL